MENKISIIVPIYKIEKYLPKCIESILNQSFKEFELILVNDGSPDRCGEICEEYSKKDTRIKVIHKENGGLSSARNAGISIAAGDYIGFVDGDDFIHYKMYELLYKKAEDNRSDIVICDYYKVYEKVYEKESIPTESLDTSVQSKNYVNIEALNELYGKNDVKFVLAWNKLYKRNLFEDLRYEQGRIHEDEFIAHRLLFKSSRVTYLPIKLYFYLQTRNSITRSKFNLKRLDAVYALKDRVDFFKNIKQKDLQHKAEFRYIQLLFSNYYKVRNECNGVALNEIMKLRKDFFKSLKSFLKNPLYNKKEKAIWILFIISPLLYDLYFKIIENKKETLDVKNRP